MIKIMYYKGFLDIEQDNMKLMNEISSLLKILVISFLFLSFQTSTLSFTAYKKYHKPDFHLFNTKNVCETKVTHKPISHFRPISWPFTSFIPLNNNLFTDPDCPGLYIPFTSVAPIIDNNIDACWSTSPIGSFPNTTVGTMQADFIGSQWRALYDNNNLYILVEVKDIFKENDSGASWWDDDAVEIFIDGDNSKSGGYDHINDFQFAFRYNDPIINIGNNPINSTSGIQFAIQNLIGGYNVEIRIPWSTIGILPLAGNKIGIDVEVDDDENDGLREAQTAAYDNTGNAYLNPSLFGTMTLCYSSPGVTVSRSASQLDPTGIAPINFTATFTEPVTGFDALDVILGGTAGATTSIITGPGPAYNIAVSGMTGIGTVTASINAGACVDLSGNLNTASINTDNTVNFDNIKPGVSIIRAAGQVDPSSFSPINFTANFTEPVTGFDNSDITLGGTAGATNAVITGSGSVYNVAVSGMTSIGSVSISINAGVCADLAGNTNTASINTDNTLTYDNSRPGVIITQAGGQTDPTSASPINFTATFTEPVIGFDNTDITLGGTAGATTVVISGPGPYNLAVSGMTGFGTVTVNIDAGVCSALLGNTNTASVNTDNIVTFNNSKPGVTITQAIGQADPTSASPINFTATFTEPVTGFDNTDITLGGTAGATMVVISGTGPYNLAVSGMIGPGTVTVNIEAGVCSDLLGHTNTVSVNTDNTVTYDNLKPGVTITQAGGQTDPASASPINFTAIFTEPITGLDNTDITLGGTAGATTAVISGTGPYNLAVSGMIGPGTVTVNINAGVCSDLLGNTNTASVNTYNTVIYDNLKPSVTITQSLGQTDPTSASPINFTATFTEPVTGFDNTDITLGGTAGATTVVISGTGPYNLAVGGMAGDGPVTVNINAGVCSDLLGNTNTASINTDNIVTFDNSKPGVNITQTSGQADPTSTSPINFSATFTEPITGFDNTDITLGGTAGATTAVISGTGPYNLAVSGMISPGTVTVNIDAGVCSDLLGNTNTASVNTDNTVTYDNLKPGVTITQSVGQTDPTSASPINFTATLTESVTGFDNTDITLGGTAGATTVVISGTGPYNLSVSGMIGPGTVTVNINAGVCSDLLGNTNTASVNTNNTVIYDNLKPEVTISSSALNPSTLAEIPLIIRFSEKVTGFDKLDINIINGTIGSFIEIIQGIQWDGFITVSAEGIINVQLPANVSIDDAGNGNNASNNFQIEYNSLENDVFDAANIITPNSTLNRYWTIKNINLYKDYMLYIRNGNGQIVYQTSNYQNNWNGTYNNKPLPTGTYYYFLSNPSINKMFKGFINIIYE